MQIDVSEGQGPELLVDTSVAVALCSLDHVGRQASVAAVAGHRIGLAGHAAFETFSVLTRLPGAARITPAAVGRLLAANFSFTRHLSASAASSLIATLAREGIGGGSVYDALVAATALEHGVPLVTRDTRALATYRAIGARLVVVST
jgi:predicted nucleic acid-binding protein